MSNGTHARFRDYLIAIDRKAQIAMYHNERLAPMLNTPADRDAKMPPIPIQAHFEGIVRAPIAMFDQLIAGIADVVPDMPQPHSARAPDVCDRLRGSASPPALAIAELIESLQRDPRLSDARNIRNMSAHAYYEKYQDNRGWYVEVPRYLPDDASAWTGERYLGSYANTMLELATAIGTAAEHVANCLVRMRSRVAP